MPEPERPASPLRYAGLGIQFAAALLLGVLGGQWLDRKAGTDGVFVIIGAFLGFGLTLFWLLRQLSGGGGPKR